VGRPARRGVPERRLPRREVRGVGRPRRADVRRALPANPRSLSVAIAEGKLSFEDAGGPRAYFGDPAAASAEEGRERIAALGEILADAVLEVLGDRTEQ
jgi:hypothetical protein